MDEISQLNNEAAKSDAYVEMRHIYKTFGDFCASDDVSFTVGQGSLTALLGPSGSGKTTILRMLAGLDHPDSGEIYIGGRLVYQVEASKRGVGFVFQNYALFRYMTVFENIAFGLQVQHRPKAQIKTRVEELLELIGLSGLGSRFPNQLSGGQRQRVGIAMGMTYQPKLLLADEPTSALDVTTQAQIVRQMMELRDEYGTSIIIVTHDLGVASYMADKVVVMKDGKIEDQGDRDYMLHKTENAYTRKLMEAVPSLGGKRYV